MKNKTRKAIDNFIHELKEKDFDTLFSRASRLRKLNPIRIPSVPTIRVWFLKREAKLCYVNGCYRSSIICSSNAAEHSFIHMLIATSEDWEETYSQIENARARVKEAKKCEASGALEDAIEPYTAAIEFARACACEPDCELYYKRGCTYQKMGEMEKAVDDFKVFLLADDRHAELDTNPWGFLKGATKGARIGLQRTNAKRCVTQQTFKKILSTYDFGVGYSNKKLYDWRHAIIGDTPEESRKMQKEKPQEAAYRKGVKHLLQGKYKKAIQYLDEAIEINPEDARSYLYRGIARALQSHKGGCFGPSSSARELSKTKALSDIERAKALSKGDALIEQACMRAHRQ